MKRAKSEFPRQRDVLAAGLYEPFVPPESLPPVPPAGNAEAARAGEPALPATASPGGKIPPSGGGRAGSAAEADPSTQDLLSTLPGPARPRSSSSDQPASPASGGEVSRDLPAERVAPQVSREPAAISSETEAPVLESAEPRSGAAAAGAEPYTIQVGAFGDADAAGRRAKEVRRVAPDLPVEIRRQDGWLKVFVGSFVTREEGESALGELTARGLGAAWVTRVAQ